MKTKLFIHLNNTLFALFFGSFDSHVNWSFTKFHPIIYYKKWDEFTLDLLVNLGAFIISFVIVNGNKRKLEALFLYKNKKNELKLHRTLNSGCANFCNCPYIKSGKHWDISL